MKPAIFYLTTALICLGVFATLSTLKWLKDQTRHEHVTVKKDTLQDTAKFILEHSQIPGR